MANRGCNQTQDLGGLPPLFLNRSIRSHPPPKRPSFESGLAVSWQSAGNKPNRIEVAVKNLKLESVFLEGELFNSSHYWGLSIIWVYIISIH